MKVESSLESSLGKRKADLHCHSMYSDGTCSPKELIDLAEKIDLSGLSITDHDTLEAFVEAYPYACEKGIILLPGVEISTQYQHESIHILGYSFNPESESLAAFCATHRMRREKRNGQIIEKLCRAGMPLSMEEVKQLSPHADSYGRPHIALAMVQRGYVKTVAMAFSRYIASGRPCYVEGEKWTVEQAIEAIRAAGGKAVLAHPHLLSQKKIIEYLLSLSIDGIEGYYGSYFQKENERWCQEAKKRGWLITGGSDFHGSIRPDTPLGASFAPEETFQALCDQFFSHGWKKEI